MNNRKIKNATPTKFIDKYGKVIPMKSKLEAECAKILQNMDIEFQYEPFSITILPSFKHKDFKGNITRAVTYTPDFIIFKKVILEIKGFPNNVYPLKRKLLLKYLVDNNYPYDFVEVHTKNELIKLLTILKQEFKEVI